MSSGSHRPSIVAALAVMVLAVGVAALIWRRGSHEPTEATSVAGGSGAEDGGAAKPRPRPRHAPEAPDPPSDLDPDELWDGFDEDLDTPWADVDLEAVRAALPDNLYWEMSAPTTDPKVIEARARERDRWNEEYGKILSGTGTEEEIHAYYDHRQRLSSDYIEFAMHLLDNYVDILPERDYGLLELAVRLHQARLEEIPRKLAEALERKRRQDALREAWLRDREAFEASADTK